MANLSKVIPGLEAFLEGDVNIENNVEVPAEEEVQDAAVEADAAAEEAVQADEAVAEEVEAAEEADENVAEAGEVAVQAELIAAQFDELFAMREHVAKFGVDRTFLSLCNRDGKLAAAFGIKMPACESFDAVGTPSSALSIACLEAMSFEGVFESIKAFVKKIWTKIVEIFQRCVLWVKTAFNSTKTKFEKVKTLEAGREMKTAEEAKDAVVDVPAKFDNAISGRLNQIRNDLTKQFEKDLTAEEFEKAEKQFADFKRMFAAATVTKSIGIGEAEAFMKKTRTTLETVFAGEDTAVEKAKKAAETRGKTADAEVTKAKNDLAAAKKAGDEAKIKEAKDQVAAVKETARVAAKCASMLVEMAKLQAKADARLVKAFGRCVVVFMKPKKAEAKTEEKAA